LEGFRRGVTVSDLCGREGIKPVVFYAWIKEFMEASKERLTRDTIRDATRQEIEHLNRENSDLKQLVAGLPLDVHRSPKNSHPGLRRKYRRMSAQEKSEVLTQVEQTRRRKQRLLA
jgi:hypothetical protein